MRIEYILENGELFEKGTGYYVLSEERFARAKWFVDNYPGYPARDQKTGKFSWPYTPVEILVLSTDLDKSSTSSKASVCECISTEPGKYSSTLLDESQSEHAECKRMLKTLDETMYDKIFCIIRCYNTFHMIY